MSGFSLTLQVAASERDRLAAELWDAGTTGITEGDDWLRAFFDEDADREALSARFGEFRPQVEEQEDYDWVRHSQAMWQPVAAGEKLWLAPEWDDSPAPDGRMRLPMRPGLACGSGSHPATRLCLEALEQTLQPGQSVLDVGTGSGILAEGAKLLGAGFVTGCDIEHDATQVAKGNLPWLPAFTGSLRSMRDDAVDVIVANLNAATLAGVGRDLMRVARHHVIVSGFPEPEAQQVERSLGKTARNTLELDGWACLIF